MRSYPVSDLAFCSAKNCKGQSVTIISRTIGDERLLFGYCQFHSMLAASFFPNQESRREIPFVQGA